MPLLILLVILAGVAVSADPPTTASTRAVLPADGVSDLERPGAAVHRSASKQEDGIAAAP